MALVRREVLQWSRKICDCDGAPDGAGACLVHRDPFEIERLLVRIDMATKED